MIYRARCWGCGKLIETLSIQSRHRIKYCGTCGPIIRREQDRVKQVQFRQDPANRIIRTIRVCRYKPRQTLGSYIL